MVPAYLASLVDSYIFSKIVDTGGTVSEFIIDKKEFPKLLDRFHQKFLLDYDAEITLCGCDMQSLIEKKSRLISLAEYYINQDNADISRNLKQNFVTTACREVVGHADWKEEKSYEVVEKYLGYFYDLVFMKETRKVPASYRAVINSYADTQHDINQDHDRRIRNLEETNRNNQIVEREPVDFSSYYKEVKRRFTSKKRGEYKSLVGEEPDETSYIDAYITEGRVQVSVISFLEDWVGNTEPGVVLIHGEPGHGKTTLCNKASFEFHKKRFLKDKAKNVVAVSLNTGNNPDIVKEGKVQLSNALVWEADKKYAFSFEDCCESLLFLDGFDELIDKAKEAGINNIFSFMEKVDDIAAKYGIHIVVLSRTIAVTRELKDLGRNYKYYKLMPVSDEQQDMWLNRHKEYDDYREAFFKLRSNKDMQKLLEVPFLFRLIVNSRFETVSSNSAELYDNIFIHLMHKRNIYDETLESVNTGLKNLAFEVYCTDTNVAKMEWDSRWVFAFYVESVDGDKIGFFHRSFYQYFLAKYIYEGIINIADENVEDFIGSFAERELDETVREYVRLMFRKGDESKVHLSIGKMIDALVRTEAYLNFTPRVESGDAERSIYLRSTNIYRNTLHIAAAVSYVIQIPFTGNLDYMMRIYNSYAIVLCSTDSKSANLRGAHLRRADLGRAFLKRAFLKGASLEEAYLLRADMSGANLQESTVSDADLSYSNMSGADLSDANLVRAVLNGANLSGANLNGAYLARACLIGAILKGAKLKEAILRDANLSGSNLKEVDLEGANLIGANLCGTNLREANLKVADLRGTDLRGAKINGTSMRGADLSYANLSSIRDISINTSIFLDGGYLPSPDEIYMNEASYFRFKDLPIHTDLRGADLRNTILERTNLNGAILEKAHMDGAYLRGADLRGAYLREANLNEADLRGTDLRKANLTGVNLRTTNLRGADLSSADLRGADLRGADLSGANLYKADLSYAKVDIKYERMMARVVKDHLSIEWVSEEDFLSSATILK